MASPFRIAIAVGVATAAIGSSVNRALAGSAPRASVELGDDVVLDATRSSRRRVDVRSDCAAARRRAQAARVSSTR